MNTLRVCNVSKHFELSDQERKLSGSKIKHKTVVDNISFEIYAGDVFGLLGPNGAGKTTTMKMLTTILKPSTGEIWYNDQSIKENPDTIRSEFAFLTSELNLDPKSTPNEMFDFFAKLYNISSAAAAERKTYLFERFGIEEFAHKKISKLSQGMKQKTSLAISVLHDPKFIIFDEPTNGLDVLAAKDVRNFILDMKKEGKCIIISTHIFDLIEKTCNKVALMVDGKIIKNDTLENIMNGKSLEDAFYDAYTKFLEDQK
jgi:sodium transport system ATP-binding protein